MEHIRGWRLGLIGIAALFLAGCGAGARTQGDETGQEDEKLQVVTTLFPYYDFTRQTAGDLVDLRLVVPAGMDSHSFEPTPADMRMIQEADILICNGGEMEHWLDEVLDAVDTGGMTVVRMMDYVDTVEEELVEGMEDADHDGHGHSGESYIDHDGHETEIEYDEHIWTSPVNAMRLVEPIRDVLVKKDPAHAEEYRKRARIYLAQLKELDAGFLEVSQNRKRNLVVLGDKFPFRYLADEYRFDYRAAFSGCSGDTEPSAQTIAYLIDKMKKEQIPVVYYLELSSRRVADIIAEETGAEPLLLHSCHNVTRAEFDSGITYVELMKQNIENLRKGLDE